MLILKEGVQGIDVQDLNEMYRANLKDNPEPIRLQDAFDWNKTKEGYQFWAFVDSITRVKPEIDAAKKEISVLPEPLRATVEKELDRTARNKSKSLKFSFKWEASPQGRAFWTLVANLIRMYGGQSQHSPQAYQPSTSNGVNAH